MEFHRGRLIDHVRIVVKDIASSRAFYAAVLPVLGISFDREGKDWFLADELMVIQGKKSGGKMHLALQAKDHETVQRFYDAALAAGARKKSPPGKGDAHPFYFFATVLDPDGNAIEAVCHGPVTRSVASVVFKPSALALLKGWL
jgi:catechol 2,3-dioxygenase-like lactoylglutathione lyase family enzyme